ncbi:MAG: hypothetical protein AUG85_01660 [Gemmatimonadetes bacterium 13_1_20CM_4_66_11]|nr:MAG: hypothetical protein AUG85_01660 [Gemmatimonadetes bacterium 13_1_20CM_4_66_11]
MSRAAFAVILSVVLPASAIAQAAPAGSAWPPLKVVDVRWIDTTVSACGDFSRFANGAWLAHDTIPAAYSSSGVTRDMSDRNELVVRSVLEDAAAHRSTFPPDSTPRKLGTFYATCMDSTAIEAAGANPIRPWLLGIDSITTRTRLLPQVAKLQVLGVNVAFRYSPDVDPHDAAHYLTWLSQGGLGLPDRDYYLAEGAAADSTRRAFVTHVASLLRLVGQDSVAADGAAAQVMALETSLAQASMTRVERRDPAKTDHPMSVEQLTALASRVGWPGYFRAIGLRAPVRKVNVAQPDFVHRVDSLLQATPLAAWRAYLTYHTVASAAPWLSTAFVNEDFAFRSRFSGAKALLPRWKRCLRETDGDLGEALGRAYVAKTFPPEARTHARAVIDDIRAAFHERLLHLTWMTDSTRAQALDKLARMGEKVGYPDRWRDYTVNAYYDATKNEMVFPAGALMPQTFDARADDAANYGSLGGSWAGHELTHGFDDEGRHYDARGNLRDWWQPSDSTHFVEQAALVERQFNEYIQVDTFHVNGKLTEGENIADWGGLLVGYDALQAALARSGRPGLIEGYTPEQRYFISYAQSWRVHNRPEQLRTRVTVDPHAPEQWRVNGPLSNIPAFARAFGCKEGDAMVRPKQRVPSIW